MALKINLTGFVVAGGKSSRMGRDKAWLEIGGKPMIQHVIDALKQVTPGVAIIANDEQYSRLGLPVYHDSNVGIGPIEAIRTALANCPTDWAAVVACDVPFVTADLLNFMIARSSGFDAVAPLDSNGQLEPLCALYSTSALSAVTTLIEEGQRRPSEIFARVVTNTVPFSEFAHLPGAGKFFKNVNTPADYAESLKDADEKPSSLT